MPRAEIEDWRGRDHAYYEEGDGVRYTGEFGKLMHYRASENHSFKPVDLRLAEKNNALVMDGHGFFGVEAYRKGGEGCFRLTHYDGQGIEFGLPSSFRREANRQLSFSRADLAWVYSTTKLGTKLEARVDESRGKYSCSFPYTLFGGAQALEMDEESGVLKSGELLTLRPPTLETADGISYPGAISDWKLQDGVIYFVVDDHSLPKAAYPYLIDPTTTFDEPTFMSGTDDQWVERIHASSWFPTGAISWTTNGTTIDTNKGADVTAFYLDNGLWRWNTSSLPDSLTVNSVTVSAYVTARTDSDGDSFGCEWYQWDGVSSTDSQPTAVFNAIASIPVSSLVNLTQYTWTVINGAANISTSGTTYMRGHISGHPTGNANGPSGHNRVRIASVEHTTQREMRLNVTYTSLSDLIGMVHI